MTSEMYVNLEPLNPKVVAIVALQVADYRDWEDRTPLCALTPHKPFQYFAVQDFCIAVFNGAEQLA